MNEGTKETRSNQGLLNLPTWETVKGQKLTFANVTKTIEWKIILNESMDWMGPCHTHTRPMMEIDSGPGTAPPRRPAKQAHRLQQLPRMGNN